MYSLLDHTSQIFLNPITFINDGDAIRWFGTVVNNKDEATNISLHPEQFTLFRLQDYNDQTGIYIPRDLDQDTIRNEVKELQTAPKQIITGIEVQTEETKSFTIKQLISMLKAELQTDNVINIGKEA